MTGSKVLDSIATWADSAAADTEQALDVPKPSVSSRRSQAVVMIHNPSTVTALTVKVQNVERMSGTDRSADLETIAVPIGGTVAVHVDGFLVTGRGRIALSNDSALGAGDGFDAEVTIRNA